MRHFSTRFFSRSCGHSLPAPEVTPAPCWQPCCHSCLPGSCCALSASVNWSLAALPSTAYLKPLFLSKGRAFPAGSENHLQDCAPVSTHVIPHTWPNACALQVLLGQLKPPSRHSPASLGLKGANAAQVQAGWHGE